MNPLARFSLPLLFAAVLAPAQETPPPTTAPPASVAPGGDPRPGGPGGFGMMMMRTETKLLEKFDADGNHVLNAAERQAARAFLAAERAAGRLGRGPGGRPFGGPPMGGTPGNGAPAGSDAPRPEGAASGGFPSTRGGGGPFGRRENQPPPEPGRPLTPGEVKSYPGASLYDLSTLRTFFFQLEESDWEKELADFHDTDVEVPARMTVDGKTYLDVGLSMRGMSSFMMVGEGRKRSLGVSLDLRDEKQKIGGYHSLHLLNSHEDPSYLRPVLFNQIAREYLPAPQTNLVRVVIKGECWGVYVNQESFTKEFIKQWFGSKKGVRWKVPGNPGARGGLEYIGEDAAEYRKRFELKSKDTPEAWAHLIRLCRVLNETPAEQLEVKLAPFLDIDEALRFLALDNVFINGDGYWTRSSDYGLYEDESGCFHLIPHDTNETFSVPGGGPGGPRMGGGRRPGGPDGNNNGVNASPGAVAPTTGTPGGPMSFPPGPGPGFGGGPRVKGVELDPLVAQSDARKPLLSKLLAVPALRTRYLAYVHEMADKWLDWARLGPLVAQYSSLIAEDVALDTRKLESTEAFTKATAQEPTAPAEGAAEREISLRDFADRRRAYLRSYTPTPPLAESSAVPK